MNFVAAGFMIITMLAQLGHAIVGLVKMYKDWKQGKINKKTLDSNKDEIDKKINQLEEAKETHTKLKTTIDDNIPDQDNLSKWTEVNSGADVN